MRASIDHFLFLKKKITSDNVIVCMLELNMHMHSDYTITKCSSLK
jgi:hypothetical protein